SFNSEQNNVVRLGLGWIWLDLGLSWVRLGFWFILDKFRFSWLRISLSNYVQVKVSFILARLYLLWNRVNIALGNSFETHLNCSRHKVLAIISTTFFT
ncbi:hypothetical protein L9F63_020729, partial [Diploptera punctata]